MRSGAALAIVLAAVLVGAGGCGESANHADPVPVAERRADGGFPVGEPAIVEPEPVAAPPVSESNAPLLVQGEVEPPKKISGGPMGDLPPECRISFFMVRAVIDVDGRVGDVQLIKGPPCALEVARKTLAAWRFEPARLRGEPVAVYYNLSVNIHLR